MLKKMQKKMYETNMNIFNLGHVGEILISHVLNMIIGSYVFLFSIFNGGMFFLTEECLMV